MCNCVDKTPNVGKWAQLAVGDDCTLVTKEPYDDVDGYKVNNVRHCIANQSSIGTRNKGSEPLCTVLRDEA